MRCYDMGPVELVATAASLSLLAGWRLYATVLVAGLSMRFGWLPLPDHMAALQVLGNSWVLGIAAVGAAAELLADKIAWVDSAWDTVHSLVRPIGGAALAMAMVDPADPVWQVAVVLLGGGAAFLSHGAKAGTRAALNTSPEPVSNVVMSTVEDVVSAGALALAVTYPLAALLLVAVLLLVMVGVVLAVRRFVKDARSLFRRRTPG